MGAERRHLIANGCGKESPFRKWVQKEDSFPQMGAERVLLSANGCRKKTPFRKRIAARPHWTSLGMSTDRYPLYNVCKLERAYILKN